MPAGGQSEEEDNPRIFEPGELRKRLIQQEKEQKLLKSFKTATRRFRPRKSELGTVVLIAATKTSKAKPGDRVSKNYKGKVYAIYVNRNKKVTPYKEYTKAEPGKRRKAKTKSPVAYKPTSIDPQNFKTKAAKTAAQKLLFIPGDRLVRPVIVQSKTGNVQWHEAVVPKVIRATKSLVKKAFGKGEVGDIPILYEVKATVITPEGETIEVGFSDSLGQRKEQQSTTDLYQGFIERRLYAGIAEMLSERGLVSRGSAKRIGSLPENRGKPMNEWTILEKPWRKRNFAVSRVAKIEVLPRLVRITSK